MNLVDSNIWLRFLEKNDDVVKLVDWVRKGSTKYYVPVIVLTEIEWVLRNFYKREKEQITSFLEAIMGMNNIVVFEDANMKLAMIYFKKYNIKLIDAIIASVVKEGDVVVSYDRDFDKLPDIKRIEPKDLVEK